MIVGIYRDADHPKNNAEKWADCLEERGVEVRWLDLTAPDAVHVAGSCDGIMWEKSRKAKIIRRALCAIESHLGIPVFPNHSSSWHSDDKLSQWSLLNAAGAPMPETWIFWDHAAAREWALRTEYPKVVKLSAGSKCRDVALISSTDEACHFIDGMFGRGIYSGRLRQHAARHSHWNWRQPRTFASRWKAAAKYAINERPPDWRDIERGYVYFQEFLAENESKTAVLVVGDRAFGYRRFNGPGDFRSTGAERDCNPAHLDLRCVEMAFDLCDRLGFSMMTYDFLFRHEEPVILEVSLRFLKEVRGYWNRDLEWIDEPVTPQEAAVDAFLDTLGHGAKRSS